MKRIIVSVTNDLVTDQRVFKVCKTLDEIGFDILLIGRKLKNSPSLNRDYKTFRFRLLFNKGFLFYAEYNLRLFFKLLFTKKDILLSNDLDTLLPNFLISQFQNKKLVYDSHELFTEVPELISRPRIQKTWLVLENWILPKIKYSYTVCQSIADFYNSKYQTNFGVIRNLPIMFEIAASKFPFNTKGKKVILYQGSLNIGRGLELMIDTMKFLDNFIFVIIGTGDIFEELEKKVNKLEVEDNVIFLGRIEPMELKNLTPLANIGISLEEDLGLNYKYALPNKIFDYIQAEIPVLVSNLPEMKKIVDSYNIGEILIDRDNKSLANQIKKFVNQENNNWNANLKSASKELIWEKERNKLISFFK